MKNNMVDESGMIAFTNNPKITGSFSQWKAFDMIKIEQFYDRFVKLSFQTPLD